MNALACVITSPSLISGSGSGSSYIERYDHNNNKHNQNDENNQFTIMELLLTLCSLFIYFTIVLMCLNSIVKNEKNKREIFNYSLKFRNFLNLSTIQINSIQNNNNTRQIKCAICLLELVEINYKIIKLPQCEHIFCEKCIIDLQKFNFGNDFKCPLCRVFIDIDYYNQSEYTI